MQGTPPCRTQQFALICLAVHTSDHCLRLDQTTARAKPSADTPPSTSPGTKPGAV